MSAPCPRSRAIASRKEITFAQESRFLDVLASTASVTRAARATRRHRSTWYRWRAENPAFAAAWTEAVDRGTDALEDEAIRRAVEGVLKPIFHQGKRIGTQRMFSDPLLIFLLRARRPALFGDRVSAPDDADDLIARLKAGRARIERRNATANSTGAASEESPDEDVSSDD